MLMLSTQTITGKEFMKIFHEIKGIKEPEKEAAVVEAESKE